MKNKKWILSLIIAIVIIVCVVTFDLVSKYMAENKLENLGASTDFIPGFINFVLVHNNGGGFNIFAGNLIFLIIFSLVVMSFFTYFFIARLKKCGKNASIILGISYGLIFGGFFGNLYDRVVFGFVRDFINFQFISFPVFNIADISLCLGTILLVIYLIFIYGKEDKKIKR